MESSRELIAALMARGESYASIGRTLGRNRSLIRQVAQGAKPGANLRESLRAMAGGASAPPAPPRRTTSSGTLARVRQSSRPKETGQRPAGFGKQLSARDVRGRTSKPDGGSFAMPVYGTEPATGKAWRLAGWSSGNFGRGDGYHDVEAGADPPENPADAAYITVNIEGVGYKQIRYFPTEDYDYDDAIYELLEMYG